MIKLSEAILQDKLKPGGKFGPTDYGFISMDSTGCLHWEDGKDKESVIMCKEHMELEGEIIPAEPKVMSAKEWLIEYDKDKNTNGVNWNDGNMKESYEAGYKNGRLEMWLAVKEILQLDNHLITDKTVTKLFNELKPE